MTTPPTNPDELPTGPLRPPRPWAWAFAVVLVLALLGYYWFAQRAIGRDVAPTEPQSGRGLPPTTGPSNTQ